MSRAVPPVLIATAALLVLSCGLRSEEPDPLGPNAACYVCHITFVKEELSSTHAEAEVACIRCHGLSAAHANDEDIGATKPDVVFKRPQVNPFCRTCHETHDVAPETLIARWRERIGSKPPPPNIACTDCHGAHKIARPKE